MGPICFSGTVLLIGDLSCPVSAHPVALWAFRGGQCYSVSTDPKESCHTGDLSPTVRGAGPMPKPCLYSALSLPRHCPVRAGPRLLPHYLIEDTRGPASARSWVSNAGPSGPGRERPAEASPPPSAALPGKGPESGCRWEGGLVRLVSQAGGGTTCFWAVLAGAAVAIGWGAGPRELGQGGAGKVQVLESCGTQILSLL